MYRNFITTVYIQIGNKIHCHCTETLLQLYICKLEKKFIVIVIFGYLGAGGWGGFNNQPINIGSHLPSHLH